MAVRHPHQQDRTARRSERIHYRGYARSWQAPVVDGVDERIVEQVTARAQRARLATTLCRLSRADRNVLLLVAWGQLSYDEVAEAMSIPVGDVDDIPTCLRLDLSGN